MPGMIVAPQPIAVEEGAKVLKAGGNAVDAAVTCAFVQSIVSPQMCGIGGYLILTIDASAADPAADDGGPAAIDAPALAGSGVTPDMWEGIALRPNPGGWGYFVEGKVNDVGYRSICTPGPREAAPSALDVAGASRFRSSTSPLECPTPNAGASRTRRGTPGRDGPATGEVSFYFSRPRSSSTALSRQTPAILASTSA